MLCGLPGNPTSSLHGGLASSPCCLALDSSSSFPCPTFLAITKSPHEAHLAADTMEWAIHWKPQGTVVMNSMEQLYSSPSFPAFESDWINSLDAAFE
ncbi:hypothetical protein STEG23_038289 [Scotinomys teguina]